MPSPLPIDQLPEDTRKNLERALRRAVRYAAIGAITDLREGYFVRDDLDYRRFALDAFEAEMTTLYRHPISGSNPEAKWPSD